MINFRQTKRSGFYLFWFLLLFLSTSCGAAKQPEEKLYQIPPTPSSGQPVEYGASLSEWEEATQANAAQPENSDGSNVTAANEPGDYPTQDAPTAEPVGEGYPGPELEENQLDNGSVESDNAGSAAVVDDVASNVNTTEPILFTLNDVVYQEIMWDALVPENFTAAAIMAKYQDQLAEFEDGSPEAYELYTQMQEEFNSAPVNEAMNGVMVRLPGFIAPLDYSGDFITEFLLVPYFGACIHVPPPPANQTVLVKLPEGQGIKFEDAYYPFWIMGRLTAEGATTDLAEAGYYIENALFELYSDDS